MTFNKRSRDIGNAEKYWTQPSLPAERKNRAPAEEPDKLTARSAHGQLIAGGCFAGVIRDN